MRCQRSLLLILLCLGVVGNGCKKRATPPDLQPATVGIVVSTVHAVDGSDTLDLPARVEADPEHLVHLYAPLSGRLLRMNLVPGQEVRKGEMVGLLQSGDVAQARSDFEKAHIEVVRADAALTRGKLLAAHEVLPASQLEELQATDDAAHSEQERARQRIHELGFSETGTSDTTALTAPISGTVLDIGTAAGELQRSVETANGIATIANLDEIWVAGDVFEQDLHLVHRGEPVTVTFAAYPGLRVPANVSNIGDALDPATHAVKVRVVLANPDHRFKPDMFATLHLTRPASPRILLPLGAVLHEGNGTVVYVPAGNGKFVTQGVTTGNTVGDRIEITAGLHDGQQVVTQGAAFLREPVGD